MSFLDKARAGYENLAGRADSALDSATSTNQLGDIDQHYRDLGVIAYLSMTGRPVDPAAQHHLVAVLSSLEERGAIRDFILQTTGRSPAGVSEAPEREGGSDGVPQPPPERAGRHGDFLSQPRRGEPSHAGPPAAPAAPQETWAPSAPEETGPRPTPPPPSIGGTWGPPPR